MAADHLDRDAVAAVRAFIDDSWERTVRRNTESHGDLIGLPHPYTVPSISDTFQEMYYWDTYFTNEGLIVDGRLEQAIHNAQNIAHLVDLYGRVPNGNRTWFENRSQPPFLAMIVERIHRARADRRWLGDLLPVIEREYHFWMTSRLTPCGLNRYSHEGSLTDRIEMLDTVGNRLGPRFRDATAHLSPGEQEAVGSHHLAEAESGWDFTPRFDARCEDFCPVDLNAYLHRYEVTLAGFATELGRPADSRRWWRRASRRRALIRRYCRDPLTGMYHDYDFVRERRSHVRSAAVFSLLYSRALSPTDAVRLAHTALAVLEQPHGIAACAEADDPFDYQWSFPNAWAPLTFLACVGLATYGRGHDSRRLAAKYVGVVTDNFATTGNLWEKYNAVDGSVNVTDEYPMPPMIGWSAGVFVWAADLLGRAAEEAR